MSRYAEIVRRAVISTLGEENEYMQKILMEQLENDDNRYIINVIDGVIDGAIDVTTDQDKILKLPNNKPEDTPLEIMNNQIDNSQIKIVIDEQHNNFSIGEQQIISKWVISSLLKDNIRRNDENSSLKFWKLVNGTLATILPFLSAVTVGIIEYFIVMHTKC